MGEIFDREKPPSPLAFTGERLTSSIDGQIEIEHFHRYFVAREYCRGKDILDIASGEGYGAALLSQVSRSVTGVEISAEAVAHARASYNRDNLKFLVGDARAIPLAAASVDAVVSFETIEHFYEQEAYVAEVRRVLRPGGVFLVSTPERDVYSPYDSPANLYHKKELSRKELEDLLRPHFPYVVSMLQRSLIGSAMVPAEDSCVSGPPLTFERRGDYHFEASPGLPRALFIVSIASDVRVSVPPVTVNIETSQLAIRERLITELQRANATGKAEVEAANARCEAVKAEVDAANTRCEVAKAEAETARSETGAAQSILAVRKAQAAQSEADLLQSRHDIEHLEAALTLAMQARADALSKVEAVYSSTTWRLLGPIRRIGRGAPTLARLPRRGFDTLVRGVRRPSDGSS